MNIFHVLAHLIGHFRIHPAETRPLVEVIVVLFEVNIRQNPAL